MNHRLLYALGALLLGIGLIAGCHTGRSRGCPCPSDDIHGAPPPSHAPFGAPGSSLNGVSHGSPGASLDGAPYGGGSGGQSRAVPQGSGF